MTRELYLKKYVEGLPSEENIAVRETILETPVKKGDVQIRMTAMSADTSMPNSWKKVNPLTYLPSIREGDTILCLGAGEVVKSQSSLFNEGDIVSGIFPAKEIFNVSVEDSIFGKSAYPAEVTLSLLGSAGLTAFVGVEIGKAKEIAKATTNPTALVTSAGGGVGLYVLQLLKQYGYTVIGVTSTVKVDAVSAFCDHVINRNALKTMQDYLAAFNQFEKIDFMFDNAGSVALEAAIEKMSSQPIKSTIICCGTVSLYSKFDGIKKFEDFELIQHNQKKAIGNTTVEGFLYTSQRHSHHFEKAPSVLAELYEEGRIKVQNHLVSGFENFVQGYKALYEGKNIGKILIIPQSPV